jgi:Uma2 family endonuclease
MPLSETTYTAVVLEDPEGRWELHQGKLLEKPLMSSAHSDVMMDLGVQLATQLDRSHYRVRVNSSRIRREDVTYFIPDVMVVPADIPIRNRNQPFVLEVFDEPLPFVAEVWSPSTGQYDIELKLPEYRKRRDAEIWRIHPFDRTVTAWRRQPDGTYAELFFSGGRVQLAALPEVWIDLDLLLA